VSLRGIGVSAAAMLVCLALTACVSSGLARGKSPHEAATVNMQLAVEYMKLNNLPVAQEKMERALSQDPNNPTIESIAGVVYERIGDNTKAEHYFAAAAKNGKKDPDVLNNYAGFLCRTGRTDQGEKMFLGVAQNPLYRTPDIALTSAGVCVRGTPAGGIMAEQYFRRALAINPNSTEALLQLGDLCMERDDAAQASDIVRQYLASNKPTPEFYSLGMRAERKLGNPAGAAAYAHKLENEFPSSSQSQELRSGAPR
jgi:type IV pilus assembly protein PilF